MTAKSSTSRGRFAAVAWSGPKRPFYVDNQYLRAEDLKLEQEYLSERLRRLHRFCHGFGVVAGGNIRVEDSFRIVLGEGYAISPRGDELYFPEGTEAELQEAIESHHGRPAGCVPSLEGEALGSSVEESRCVYLVARLVHAQSGLQVTAATDCRSPGAAQGPRRVCSGVQLGVVGSLVPPHAPEEPDCGSLRELLCPPARTASNEPSDRKELSGLPLPLAVSEELNYVVLGRLWLTDAGIQGVDDHGRRVLLPGERLQAFLQCECRDDGSTPTGAMDVVSLADVDLRAAAELPVDKINGIGQRRAELLKARGVTNGADFVRLSPEELASILGIAPTMARNLLERARETVQAL